MPRMLRFLRSLRSSGLRAKHPTAVGRGRPNSARYGQSWPRFGRVCAMSADVGPSLWRSLATIQRKIRGDVDRLWAEPRMHSTKSCGSGSGTVMDPRNGRGSHGARNGPRAFDGRAYNSLGCLGVCSSNSRLARRPCCARTIAAPSLRLMWAQVTQRRLLRLRCAEEGERVTTSRGPYAILASKRSEAIVRSHRGARCKHRN